MKHKIPVVLVVALVLTQMAGCGAFKKVTAEDLITDAFTKLAEAESSEMNMKLVLKASAEVEDGVNMSLGMEGDIDIETEDKLTHTKGDITVDILGMNVNQEVESWTQIEGNMSYTYDYDADTDTWTVSEEKAPKEKDLDTELIEFLDNIELKERDSRKDNYVVTATLNSSKANSIMGEFGDSSLDGLDPMDVTDEVDFDFNVKMTFDAESKDIVKLELIAEDITDDEEEATIDEFSMKIKIKSINEDLGLKIPKSVLENAVASDYDDGYDFDFDDFGYDNDDFDDYDFDYDDDNFDDFDIDDTKTSKPENTKEPSTDNTTVKTTDKLDFNRMVFYVNNKEYTLGKTTIQDLLDDGVKLDDEFVKTIDNTLVSERSSDMACIEVSKNDDTIVGFIKVTNFTKSDMLVKDAPISYVSFEVCDYYGNKNTVVHAGFDSDLTSDEVRDKFGKPSYEYSSEIGDIPYESLEYEYDYAKDGKGYTYRSYSFNFTNGKLQELDLNYEP